MKSKLKNLFIISIVFFCVAAKAEVHKVKVRISTSECAYVDGTKECYVKYPPYDDVEFNLIKGSDGKYFSYKEMKTYIRSELYKVSILLIKETIGVEGLLVRMNLISRATSETKESKVVDIKVNDLSELAKLSFEGVPVITIKDGYLNELKHSIHFN